ncbi:MAG: AAA family ATPase [Isosphaeraceae bacterium]
MKFLRVIFRCFGPFEDQPLDLSGPGGFHVVFGPNEAGKSSALRGLHAFLFGFPVQSDDDFRFKYAQFRIHALLENSARQTLDCVRRKGKKATLLESDGRTEIPDSSLARFLGNVQEQQFEQLFGLDSKRLVDGGREIAEGRGDLGEAIFAAGAGLAGLRALAQSFEERQRTLYKFQGQIQPINKALSDHEKQLTSVRENTLPPDTYAAAAIKSREAQERAETLRRERIAVRSELGLLHRYQSALPTIELLQRARQRLEPVADAPLLAADFDAKLNDAREKREVARRKLGDLAAGRDELERQIRDEQPPAAVLAEEAEIDELKKLVGADAKQQSEAVKADTRRSEEEATARDIFRELTGSTAWDQMTGLKLRLDHQQRITELANEQKAVLEDLTNCARAVRLAREALAVAVRKEANAAATSDPAPWLAAVESIAALGPVEQHARSHQSEAENQELRLVGEFARLQPPPPGDWCDAASLPVPSTESVMRFRQEFDKAEHEFSKVDGDLAQIDHEMLTLREQLADTAGAERVPTADDLADARHDRDGGLNLVRRRLTNQADVSAEADFTTRNAPGRSLIDAAEVTVRQCDALADRMRHEADRVATYQALRQKLKLLQNRREEIEDERTAAEAALAMIKQAWQAAWRPSGISPETPEVMQAWLTRWQQFTERVIAWNGVRLECGQDQQQIDHLRAQLADACPITQTTKTLAEGLALARQVGTDAKNDQAAAEKLKDEVLRLRSEFDTAEKESARAEKRRDKWTEQWSGAIAPLRLGESSVSIETVQDYLRNIGQMQQHLAEMRIKAARVKEIAEERALLLQRFTALRQRLDSTARPTTAETLDAHFREVDAALTAARIRRTQHEELAKQLRRVKTDVATTNDKLREADATLAALAAQAGVLNIDGIAQAVQRANERTLAARQVQEQEHALAQNTRGQPLDAFVAQALEHRDRLDGEIESLDDRAKQLDPDITSAEADALKAEQVLDGYRQASDAAAEAKQQAELIAGRLEELVIEFAACHLSRVALDRAKERYRARHQGSLLDRAGEFFKTLTDQAFEGLDIDNEEGADVLRAVRAGGRSTPSVPVGGLSDGTRDQLFLALRLAGIEQHLLDREPIPLIIDDVLVSFDDARARATLKCLAELATKTQVLLFTHHRHVVDLAIAVKPDTVVHQLVPAARL